MCIDVLIICSLQLERHSNPSDIGHFYPNNEHAYATTKLSTRGVCFSDKQYTKQQHEHEDIR